MPTQVDPLQHLYRTALRDVTPVRLRLLLLANFVGALVFAIVCVTTIKQHEHGIQTVGLDAAPSVIAAQQIKIGVEQMDTDLANELLLPAGQPEGQDMSSDFEKWRVAVSKQLVAAAKNITYGKAEQLPIENLQIALGQFLMQAQSARDMHASNKPGAIQSYRQALETLQEDLIPNADLLNKANADLLESTYSDVKAQSGLSRGLVVVVGMVLLALLVYTQIYLKKRFRRRINLPLLIATVVTALFLNHVTASLASNGRDLKIAKEDAYNSIVALLDARANAYAANASESRWLLDTEHAPEHEKYFLERTSTIAHFAANRNCSEVIERAQKQLSNQEKFNLSGFSGYLSDELHNIRFDGEGEAALEALQEFCAYIEIDSRMRHLESLGAHDKAIKLCLSYAPNNSKFAFTEFDEALGRALKINQDYFSYAVKAAFLDLNNLIILAECVALLIAVCTYLGLKPRMGEYIG